MNFKSCKNIIMITYIIIGQNFKLCCSWRYRFEYLSDFVTVEKGSVTINGTSLTVVDSEDGAFSVCIIPYTYEHTNFHTLVVGDEVNLEFDIIGKYVARLMNR